MIDAQHPGQGGRYGIHSPGSVFGVGVVGIGELGWFRPGATSPDCESSCWAGEGIEHYLFPTQGVAAGLESIPNCRTNDSRQSKRGFML